MAAAATSPRRAAKGLIDAWQAGDRAAAANYARPQAVQALFKLPAEAEQAVGPCQQDGETFSCPYSTASGSFFFLRAQGSRTADYRVVELTTPTD